MLVLSRSLLLFFLLSLLIIAMEGFVNFGGASGAVIWKGVLIIVFVAFYVHRIKFLLWWQIFLLLFSLKVLISKEFFDDPYYVASDISRWMFIFIIYIILSYSKLKIQDSIGILKVASILVIVSFFPFYFELVSSRSNRLENEFGVVELTGIFENPHAAALTLAASVITLLYLIKNYYISKPVGILFILIGIWFCVDTFVRMGLVVILFGFIYLYSDSLLKLKRQIFLFLIGLSLIVVYNHFVIDNFVIYSRIFDLSPTGEQRAFGSGRLEFWFLGFSLLLDLNLLDLFFGVGRSYQLSFMMQNYGLPVTSHNSFIDALVQHGLFGFSLFCAYLLSLYLWSKNVCSHERRPLSSALFVGFIVFQIFQGGSTIFFDFFLCVAFWINSYGFKH